MLLYKQCVTKSHKHYASSDRRFIIITRFLFAVSRNDLHFCLSAFTLIHVMLWAVYVLFFCHYMQMSWVRNALCEWGFSTSVLIRFSVQVSLPQWISGALCVWGRNRSWMGHQAITVQHAHTFTHPFTPTSRFSSPDNLPCLSFKVGGNRWT